MSKATEKCSSLSLEYAEQSSRSLGSQSTNDGFDVTVIEKATKMFLEFMNDLNFENHIEDYTFYRGGYLYRDLRLTYQSPRNAQRTLS